MWSWVIAGLFFLVVGGYLAAFPQAPTCSGHKMRPGDSCRHLELTGDRVQSYGREVAGQRRAGWFMLGFGGLFTAIGAVVIERRRRAGPAAPWSPPPDAGPGPGFGSGPGPGGAPWPNDPAPPGRPHPWAPPDRPS